MIAPESWPRAFPWSKGGALPKPIPAEVEDEGPTPAQTLAGLYRRCGAGGGCPYSLDQLLRVLQELRHHSAVVAPEIAGAVELPASAVYGCILEAEDYGLVRWIPEPVTTADNITAEITAAGVRFLREITMGGRY